MLPPYVNLIFLSATTPNTVEFSDWYGLLKFVLLFLFSLPDTYFLILSKDWAY